MVCLVMGKVQPATRIRNEKATRVHLHMSRSYRSGLSTEFYQVHDAQNQLKLGREGRQALENLNIMRNLQIS